MQIVKVAIKPPRDGQQFEPAQRLRHQRGLYFRPASLVFGQADFAAVFALHQIDDRQVDLAVVNRPLDQIATTLGTYVSNPHNLGIIASPEQPPLCELLIIQPLTERIL